MSRALGVSDATTRPGEQPPMHVYEMVDALAGSMTFIVARNEFVAPRAQPLA
jgi:hypothetical protein